jgi:hypothetical protein
MMDKATMRTVNNPIVKDAAMRMRMMRSGCSDTGGDTFSALTMP